MYSISDSLLLDESIICSFEFIVLLESSTTILIWLDILLRCSRFLATMWPLSFVGIIISNLVVGIKFVDNLVNYVSEK